ncbi:hypothetical protein IU449_21940 [Nocardia higoensis]|uniref:Uncharacterized protein n=1 Tax=Nocardia higoensis TaxID=228599 RepID=A0ABS0DFB5_9NOCA|nr:hypothetical protein [Nocardia higoensis]MBF6357171.1 hypothetical protein [Nocardia higoensis]
MRRTHPGVPAWSAIFLALACLVPGCALLDDGTGGGALPTAGPPIKEQVVPVRAVEDTEIAVSESWTVTVPAGAAPAGATFAVQAAPDQDGAPAISRADLTLSSGQPSTPLEFTYRTADPVPNGVEIFFVGRPSGTDDSPAPSTVVAASLDADRRTATAEIPHLSWWEVFATEANHVLTSAAGLRTNAPSCETQPRPAWLEEAAFLEGRDAPMLVCTGADPNDRETAVVKIRNNRGVAMIVTAPVTPKWAYAEAFSGLPSAFVAEFLTATTEAFGVPSSERSRTWVLPPGTGLDIGFTERSLSAQPASKITTRVSTSSVAYGLIWNALAEHFDDPTALTAIELGIMGVCFGEGVNSAVTASDAGALAAAVARIAGCAIQSAPDIIGEISGHLSDEAWNALQRNHAITGKIGELRFRLLPLLAVAEATIVIGDTLSALALGSGAYEIALFTAVGAQAGLASLCREIDVRRTVRHPNLGEVTVGLGRLSGAGEGCIAVVDRRGSKLLVQKVSIYGDELDFADPATDSTNNVFITYNPGRYNGVITLVPVAGGYADIGWNDPDGLNYQSTTHAYYYAELIGPGDDGRYAIEASSNDCEPDCAGGTITKKILRWNGSRYE